MLKKKSIKTGKSLLAFLLAAVMVLAMIPAVAVHAETATYNVADYKGEKATDEWTYPSEEGKVFAGWFSDADYTTPYTDTTGNAYAKFVDASMMTVKIQYNADATKADETVNIRFLTAIKDTKLASVTFNVVLATQDKNWTMTETKCYSSVLEGSATVATSASTIFGSDATYFVVHTLNNVPKAVYGENFTAYVSWKTLDGTVVTGETRTFNVNDELSQETAPDTSSWTTVSLLDSITGFINNNGSLTRPGVSGGAAVFATSEGNAANQLLCQFANAAENVKSFEISTTVTAGTGRRGVGFKTPSGYLFFNVTKEGGANGAGYVWYNTDYEQQTQDYVALSMAAKAVVAGAEVYTLKIAAENLTGTSSDTITLYVNDIAVYTYTNTLGWDLTEKVLPAIGVRGGPASATFTNYTFKVVYEEPKQDDTCEHTGGTATCKTQATCEICGEPYGELAPENHVGETEIRDAKEATSSEAGYTGDTYCKACNTKIADGTVIDATGDNTDIMTAVDNLSQVTGSGFINNGGSLDRTQESSGIVTLNTNEGSYDNQILLQFANAAQNISAFEISATVTAGTGRRGVGFKTPDGYLFFNVVENGGDNGAGYVEFNVSTTAKMTQAYQALDAAAETVITGTEVYTLKLMAENLTGEATDTITFYVNDIAVYTYTNTLGWDLTAKVLPAIGVRGSGANATFTDYTFKVLPKTETLTLAYDDRYTCAANIASVETISVTSKQVGTGSLDTAVLAASGDGNTYIATGVGIAKVTLENGIVYNVTVEPAKISVALLAGQSNAEGWGTEAKRKLSIACPDGQVYSTYGFSNTDFARINGITATASDALSETTAKNFVATSLTSNVSYGGTKLLYPLNSMTESGKGKIGIDSGLAYEWNKQTGEKIWVVNCGHGGSSITTWVPGGTNYKECIALMSYVKQTMEAEIAAGHYELSQFMYFWCQGEADNSWMAQADYHENLKLVHNGLKTDLTLNGKTLGYGGNIIVYANGENNGVLDIADTGVRLAQKQACAETTGDFADFYMACDVNEQWVTDAGVAEYWETKYPNSVYPFTLQEGTYQNPTTVAEVEGDKIHYMAPAYNEIGIVCADSAYEILFAE